MNLAQELEVQEVTKNINTKNAATQIETLHPNADKYITVATIDENGKYQQRHLIIEELMENLDKLVSLNRNTYISVNEFYIPKRSAEAIRRINALYIDIDLVDKNYKISDYELSLAIKILEDEYFNLVVPEPTMIVRSGRGIHLYWKVEDLPSKGLSLWMLVQQKLMERLNGFNESFRLLKVDGAVKDCTRVLRLSDTRNTKSETKCTLESLYEDNIYRLDTLIKEYFTELIIIKKNKDDKAKITNKEDRKIIAIHNLYSLHHARLQDIVKLQEIRNGSGEIDYRRRMCFFYRYYSSLFTHDTELALQNTLEFNKKFISPLPEKQVIQASNSAKKAYEEWSSNKAEDFNKPVWNKDTGTYNIKGYNYRNTSIIRELDITEEEQIHMLTIISKKEKNRRKCEKEKGNRRNENGLTSKQQSMEDRYIQIINLKKEKVKNKVIAEMLGISEDTLKYSIKKLKREKRL